MLSRDNIERYCHLDLHSVKVKSLFIQNACSWAKFTKVFSNPCNWALWVVFPTNLNTKTVHIAMGSYMESYLLDTVFGDNLQIRVFSLNRKWANFIIAKLYNLIDINRYFLIKSQLIQLAIFTIICMSKFEMQKSLATH